MSERVEGDDRVNTLQQSELEQYRGTNPCPADFRAFWQARMAQAQQAPLRYELKAAPVKSDGLYRFQELYFDGIDGSRIYAKYIRPATDEKLPLMLHFHGYPGATRSWFEMVSNAVLGYAVLAMDCPGQGGCSEDKGGYKGTMASGNLILGLDGPPEQMYYVRVHQDIAVLCRIAAQLPGIDLSRVCINGASQGGALGLATAALHPELVGKAAIQYPFLSDFEKVWQLGADQIAYEGLRYYMRWFDPEGRRTKEIFTKLGYVDTLNFAPLVQCPVLFGTGLRDVVCPPITQYAVYNNLNCPKKHVIFPDFGHEEIQAYDDLLFDFFSEKGGL